MTSPSSSSPSKPSPSPKTKAPKAPIRLSEHVVEIVSDGGEGAQKCGQIFGSVSAKMGNGVWTVEIIPAEIQPPPRSAPGTSGNRIRLGTNTVTNWGDETNLVVAFNEQAVLSRHRLDSLADDALILLENMWENHEDPSIREEWAAAMEEMSGKNYRIVLVPMEEICLQVVDNPRKGKNMLALGMLCYIYARDMEKAKAQIAYQFRKKSEEIYERNVRLLELGYKWAQENLDVQFEIPPGLLGREMVVMNGNTALGMGAIAAGMDFMAMYPITPATSVSHYLAEVFHKVGGVVHQAEDEIAAVGCAIGASFAGKVAFTVTSGPGLALKTEFIALAVMTETPLVVMDVQRGGPSTGLPTKVEQSDLLAAIFGQPGDAPKVVLAPATIEECFHCVVTARRIAETFRAVVVILSDANLATGVQPFPRPQLDQRWQGHPPDQSPIPEGQIPFGWDPATGLSRRIIPGQPNGMFVATGLSHDSKSKVSYAPAENEQGMMMRSRKLAVLQETLKPPRVRGDDSGDMLVVGWGSTQGAIEEAVDKARAKGLKVSSTHLTFLSPLQPGLKQIFNRFKKVMTVEINHSDRLGDPHITVENRRMGQLAWLLRAQLLVDVDCWTRCHGEPLRPAQILEGIEKRLNAGGES
ncbi:MAG: 2-oxoacid:acceptor oxidoreductase subunit alpha [Planctomycetota bacterium]